MDKEALRNDAQRILDNAGYTHITRTLRKEWMETLLDLAPDDHLGRLALASQLKTLNELSEAVKRAARSDTESKEVLSHIP